LFKQLKTSYICIKHTTHTHITWSINTLHRR